MTVIPLQTSRGVASGWVLVFWRASQIKRIIFSATQERAFLTSQLVLAVGSKQFAIFWFQAPRSSSFWFLTFWFSVSFQVQSFSQLVHSGYSAANIEKSYFGLGAKSSNGVGRAPNKWFQPTRLRRAAEPSVRFPQNSSNGVVNCLTY